MHNACECSGRFCDVFCATRYNVHSFHLLCEPSRALTFACTARNGPGLKILDKTVRENTKMCKISKGRTSTELRCHFFTERLLKTSGTNLDKIGLLLKQAQRMSSNEGYRNYTTRMSHSADSICPPDSRGRSQLPVQVSTGELLASKTCQA